MSFVNFDDLLFFLYRNVYRVFHVKYLYSPNFNKVYVPFECKVKLSVLCLSVSSECDETVYCTLQWFISADVETQTTSIPQSSHNNKESEIDATWWSKMVFYWQTLLWTVVEMGVWYSAHYPAD